MKILRLAAALFLALALVAVNAQPGLSIDPTADGGLRIEGCRGATLDFSPNGQVGFSTGVLMLAQLEQPAAQPAPQVVVIPAAPAAQPQGGGFINVGQAFGKTVGPYVDAALQLLIVAAVGWACWFAKERLHIPIDDGRRAAVIAFLQNQASGLLAAGAVKMDGLKIHVDSVALADAANKLGDVIPQAAAHFGLTPEDVAEKIVQAIPQVPAGAAIVAQAHATEAAAAPVGAA